MALALCGMARCPGVWAGTTRPLLSRTTALRAYATAAPLPSRALAPPRRQAYSPVLAAVAREQRRDVARPMLPLGVLRAYSSAVPPAAPAAGAAAAAAPEVPPPTSPIVGYHLLASAALVFLIILVGGITRLTESGLSITEWNPGLKGMRWPQSEAEWQDEWAKYKTSPEFHLLNSNMTLEDFKSIFMWEWTHRMLGRFIGAFFVVPAVVFSLRRGMTTPDTRKKLAYIALGIGFQGFLGWYMVASGLKNPYENDASAQPRPDWTPRVDHFRLAAHLGTAFVVYMGMLYSGLTILRDARLAKAAAATSEATVAALTSPTTRKFRRVALGMLLLTFTTAMYGAFVAGLDAGLVYSEFPFMGENRLLPPQDELLDPRYAVRTADGTTPSSSQLFAGNLTQNPVTVQAIHRYLGLTTLAAMFVFLSYVKRRRTQLPRAARGFATGAVHMTGLQALLGITTLMYMVPLPLASMHQAGSVLVLSLLTGALAMSRQPGRAVQALLQARKGAVPIRA